jgi:hypothetical protein
MPVDVEPPVPSVYMPAAAAAPQPQRPGAWCALNAGQAGVACGYCGAFVGGALAQLGHAAAAAVARCELGCGAAYCSAACRSAAAPCHQRLCVGPVDEEHALYRFKLAAYSSGALAEFTLAAQLAVQSTLETPADGGTAWRLAAGASAPWWDLRPLGMEEADDAELAQYRADAEEVASDCWAMLCEGVPQLGQSGRTAADWARLLAAVAAEKVELSRPSLLEVVCRQAWDAGGAATLDEDLQAGLLALALATLEQRADEAAAAEQEEDEEEAEEEEEEEEEHQEEGEQEQEDQEGEQDQVHLPGAAQEQDGPDSSDGILEQDETGAEPPVPDIKSEESQRLLSRILADPSSFLPRFEAAALYPTPRLPHSCVPTCIEELSPPPAGSGGDGGGGGDALAAGDSGLELRIVDSKHRLKSDFCGPKGALKTDGSVGAWRRTVCVVDCSASEQDRAAELAAAGRPTCSCARCTFERKPTAAAAAVSTDDLLALVELAKSDGRHKDAIALLNELVRRRPTEGEVLLSRARVIGWDDR